MGNAPVAERTDHSWLALDDAIGPYRTALAELLGCSPDTLDLWCSPPPGFTPHTRSNRGRRNPIDELAAIARHCPQGLDAVKFLVESLGYHLVPQATTPARGRLLASPAVVAEAVDALLADLNRRPSRQKLNADQLRDLRDQAIDGLAALVDDAIARREKHRG